MKTANRLLALTLIVMLGITINAYAQFVEIEKISTIDQAYRNANGTVISRSAETTTTTTKFLDLNGDNRYTEGTDLLLGTSVTKATTAFEWVAGSLKAVSQSGQTLNYAGAVGSALASKTDFLTLYEYDKNTGRLTGTTGGLTAMDPMDPSKLFVDPENPAQTFKNCNSVTTVYDYNMPNAIGSISIGVNTTQVRDGQILTPASTSTNFSFGAPDEGGKPVVVGRTTTTQNNTYVCIAGSHSIGSTNVDFGYRGLNSAVGNYTNYSYVIGYNRDDNGILTAAAGPAITIDWKSGVSIEANPDGGYDQKLLNIEASEANAEIRRDPVKGYYIYKGDDPRWHDVEHILL